MDDKISNKAVPFCLLMICVSVFIGVVFDNCGLVYGKHKRLEKDYQKEWCENAEGEMEVVMPDGSRCDCLTSKYAVEFDFASKWAEAVGQSLLYASYTGMKPGIVLIMEDAEKEDVFLRRLYRISDYLNCNKIDVWIFMNKEQ